VALLICCSARNTSYVGDLYRASSSSSVRLVSFRIVAIGACSWPSQHSCLFKKFHSPIVILHACSGSRYVVRPSVVMILISSTRSSHTCDESKILTKPPAGIFWSRNQSFLISSGVSCFRRRRGWGGGGSRWHRGRFPPHASVYKLRPFFVNWVADNEWMMCRALPRGLDLGTPFTV